MINLSERIDEPEIMDSEPLGERELESTLRFLALVHRHFGGETALMAPIKEWSSRWEGAENISVLDVGTGGGDAAVSLARWGRARGLRLRITGIDSTPAIARRARENLRSFPEIMVRTADLFALADGPERFDYVVSSLLLHHLPSQRLAEALKAMDALARRGVVISDLLRSPAAYLGIKALTMLFGNRVVRNDGPLSVRRGFRLPELETLAERASLPYLSARRRPFFRLTLTGEKYA